MPSNRSPTQRLFVGSLPYSYTEGQILALFVPYGKVVSVQLLVNKFRRSRGVGFVQYENLDDAIRAKEALHNSPISDRTIIVDYADPDPGPKEKAIPSASSSSPPKFAKFSKPTNKPLRKPFSPPQRQSVYDQRHHHARVGAKLAAKQRAHSKRK